MAVSTGAFPVASLADPVVADALLVDAFCPIAALVDPECWAARKLSQKP